MSDKHQNEVTSVICRNIKSGHEKDYDDWLRRYLTYERRAPGYLGKTITYPGALAQIYDILFTALLIAN
jgi:antibiotic biosynthesis monooxygenase (ABM) superfamily enzyme